ncbi:MAG: hydroxymethylglutaryl-CoA reductase (NADPH) [Methanocorpusculum parvum]|nr:hydroxymethylglutaryl-CoA reductase (NADPH) [Methanocorpusculum parvum]
MDNPQEKLRTGELKLYALEKYMEADEAVKIRREYIEEKTGANLSAVGKYTIPITKVVSRNIENMIGCIQIPLGIAGPLSVNGEYANGSFWIPLATTEGALVASINRGCSAVSKAGGADVRIFQDAMTRAPVFAAKNIAHAAESIRWIEENFAAVKEAAEKTTSHGKLIRISTYTAGTSVYVRMAYETGDAMGMNMATIASEAAAKVIEAATGLRLIASSGNMCCDKKPAAINAVEGRGKTVSAGVFLPDELIRTVLKTRPELLIEVNMRKNLTGSARAGALGFNAHAANIIAALFLACGQDAAHVVEGSNCITTAEAVEGGIYVSVTLPSLQVGTVGGGTGVACQNECLKLMDCAGDGKAKKFAEIAAAAVLAGELSLLSALAAGQLGEAHKELGRG